jgi:hypothetical protein
MEKLLPFSIVLLVIGLIAGTISTAPDWMPPALCRAQDIVAYQELGLIFGGLILLPITLAVFFRLTRATETGSWIILFSMIGFLIGSLSLPNSLLLFTMPWENVPSRP